MGLHKIWQGPLDEESLNSILRQHAPFLPVTAVPELVAPACYDLTALWQATEEALQQPLAFCPFWATPWPGGIAIASLLLNDPAWVKNRRVLDVGCGSGIAGVAAARAGGSVILNDADPLALTVASLTARANGVSVEFLLGDATELPCEVAEVVLVGDVFYERSKAEGLLLQLQRYASCGLTVLAADAGRRMVKLPGRHLFDLEIEVSRDIEGTDRRVATVYQLAKVLDSSPGQDVY